MEFETLSLTFDAAIAEIRLNRPDLINRFDLLAHIEFVAALGVIEERLPDVRALVISAEGRAFSAGGDFEEMLEAHAKQSVRDDMIKYAKGVYYGLSRLPIPVVAAVQGAAIGLGATIATLCDIVVAWKGAKIADTHVNVALVAGDGGITSWSQSIGVNRAKRYLLTGDIITGQQAYDFGLVTELVDTPEEAAPQARAMAARIAAMAPLGVNGTKRVFAKITNARAAEAFEHGLELEMEAMANQDLFDTVTALRQKSGAR